MLAFVWQWPRVGFSPNILVFHNQSSFYQFCSTTLNIITTSVFSCSSICDLALDWTQCILCLQIGIKHNLGLFNKIQAQNYTSFVLHKSVIVTILLEARDLILNVYLFLYLVCLKMFKTNFVKFIEILVISSIIVQYAAVSIIYGYCPSLVYEKKWQI